MITTDFVAQNTVDLLSIDANSFSQTAGNNVRLITSPFTPSGGLVVADLTFAAGNGLDPIAQPSGAAAWGIDPITGAYFIDLTAPAGGWKWTLVASAAPVTIYGLAFVNGVTTLLIGSSLLPQPVVMQTIHQILDVGPITFVLVQSPFS